MISSNVDGSESDINISSCDASLTSTTDNQTDTVPSSPKSIKSEETILNSNENQNENDNESLQQPQCDDNQNNMNNLLMSNALNISNSTEKIRVNLKQLLALFAKLKRLLAELSEAKTNEQSSHKTKCDKLLSQVIRETKHSGNYFYITFLIRPFSHSADGNE